MKHKIIILILFCLLASCTKERGISEPSEIGKHVIKILKDIPGNSLDKFQESIMNFEEFQRIAKEHGSNETLSLTKEDFNSQILTVYNKIKQDAIEEGISLDNITYSDFTYDFIEGMDDREIVNGNIYFKYNNNTYKFDCQAVKIDNQFIITQIARLRKV